MLFLVLLGTLLFFGPKYYAFSQSKYGNASGNGFLKTLFNKGNYGEFLTFKKIESIGEYGHILTNIYLPTQNGTTEVDLIFIHQTGVYVFESKNYSGWIYGKESQKEWTQTLENKHKNKFYNPIWQNKGHIEAIKSATNLIDEAFFSFIVFSERCTLKAVDYYSPAVKVLKRDDLAKALKSEIASSHGKFKIEEVEMLRMMLEKYTLASEATKQAHIDQLKKY